VIAGYENIIHDSKMGIKLPNRVPDIIPPIRDRNKKDGTNVTVSVSEDHHKSEKKKRKKEHKEHKRKDNYRNQEERKHKHKHKDKDKDGHKGEKAKSSAPIKITIPKDNVSLGSTLEPVAGTGPTIKIQRHRPIICTDTAVIYTYSGPSGELKIKISKEVIINFNNSMTGPSGSNSETPSSSRKRDHSSPQSSELVPPLGPPAKAARFSTSSGEQRQSGNTCSICDKQLFSQKDKDKDGHKGEKAKSSAPIKITIPKDNVSLGSTLKPVAGTGPTIKIQRRRPIICTDSTRVVIT